MESATKCDYNKYESKLSLNRTQQPHYEGASSPEKYM